MEPILKKDKIFWKEKWKILGIKGDIAPRVWAWTWQGIFPLRKWFIIFKNIIYVENEGSLKKMALREFHDKTYSNYLGYKKALLATRKIYYFHDLKREVSKSIECQKIKVEWKHRASLLQPFPILEWRWEMIYMDLIIRLPNNSKQDDEMVDMLSNVAHFVVIRSTNSSSDVARIFIKKIMRLHGVPKKIISNRDAKFNSKCWK